VSTHSQHQASAPDQQAQSSRHMLVTCALPYANGPIHLGHLLEHIQADIWTRFQKLRGHTCLFLCADDAHGTPIMLKAEQEGITPEALIEQVHEAHLRDFKGFGVNHDHYYTTHSPENQALAQTIYHRNQEAGNIKVESIEQLYDPERSMFLADRYVKGECPKCHAPDQNGDNCDVCGATYSPMELKNPRSVVSGATPVPRQTDQLFFDLPRFQTLLEKWLAGPALQSEVANKLKEWLEIGLKPWDISREAPYFGFEIPDRPGKYFYVWMDAPIGYMASHQNYCGSQGTIDLDFETFWKPDSTGELYHFIGKDIINFHGLFWPAMLSGAQFRLPTGIFVHGFVNVNGEKMSKSKGTFITAQSYLEHLDPEYLRYFFATRLAPKVQDIDLNAQEFMLRCNSDLVGKYVNIGSRCASFLTKHFEGMLSEKASNEPLLESLQSQASTIALHYEQRDFARGMRDIMALADQVNQYIDSRAPWQMVKDPEALPDVQAVCTTGINAFRLLSLYLKPVLPSLVEKVESFLNIPALQWSDHESLLLSHAINPFKPLVSRLDQKKISFLNATEAKATKEPSNKKKKQKAPKQPEIIDVSDFGKIELRIGEIIKAEPVEGADKLLQLTVNLGQAEPRTIFAGIKSAYAPEDLVGRLTIVVANLAPKKMRFGTSEGMVLAAGEGAEGIFLISPDSGAKPGMVVK